MDCGIIEQLAVIANRGRRLVAGIDDLAHCRGELAGIDIAQRANFDSRHPGKFAGEQPTLIPNADDPDSNAFVGGICRFGRSCSNACQSDNTDSHARRLLSTSAQELAAADFTAFEFVGVHDPAILCSAIPVEK
jgi:hypothetical protein